MRSNCISCYNLGEKNSHKNSVPDQALLAQIWRWRKEAKYPLLDLFCLRTSAGAALFSYLSRGQVQVLLSSTSLLGGAVSPAVLLGLSFLRGARVYTLCSSGGNVYPCRSWKNIILSFFSNMLH